MYFLRKTIIKKYTDYSNTHNILYNNGDYEFFKIENCGKKPCFNNMTFNYLIQNYPNLLWQYTDLYYPVNAPVKEVSKSEFMCICQTNEHRYTFINEKSPNPIKLKNHSNMSVIFDNIDETFEKIIWLYDNNYKFIKHSVFDKTTQTYYVASNANNLYSSSLCLFANCE